MIYAQAVNLTLIKSLCVEPCKLDAGRLMQQTADALVNHLQNQRRDSERFFFPILYNSQKPPSPPPLPPSSRQVC